jgi:translation initiation factor 6
VESTEEDEELIRNVLKVPCKPCTINDGVPFVRSGIIATSLGAVVGSRTTGPELMTISEVLGL